MKMNNNTPSYSGSQLWKGEWTNKTEQQAFTPVPAALMAGLNPEQYRGLLGIYQEAYTKAVLQVQRDNQDFLLYGEGI